MTSTEFKIGLDGSRVSSKVLKPPGGGSSDIFGRGSTQVSANGCTNERIKKTDSSSTQNRLFGCSSEPNPTPVKSHAKTNIFEPSVTRSAQKRYVHRNPITGEEIDYNSTNYQKAETNGKPETDDSEASKEADKEADKEQNNEEEKKDDIPSKPVQTSIRVRNPPGGKSSGIF